MPHVSLDTAPLTWCTRPFDFYCVQSLILFAPIVHKLSELQRLQMFRNVGN